MAVNARYVHTNLVARDWRRLAEFYERAFDCRRLPPERDLSGAWVDRLTGLEGAHIRGVHLRLPGWGPDGPTLEIFQYNFLAPHEPPAANRPGFGHIAFAVEDVAAAQASVLEEGGGKLGELQTVDIPDVGAITLVYMTDPEGNLVELQRWRSFAQS